MNYASFLKQCYNSITNLIYSEVSCIDAFFLHADTDIQCIMNINILNI